MASLGDMVVVDDDEAAAPLTVLGSSSSTKRGICNGGAARWRRGADFELGGAAGRDAVLAAAVDVVWVVK